jgi:putative NADPH-quinone reductase
MGNKIVIVQGHPDPDPDHLCYALAGSYASGARDNGHDLREITVSQLDFPLLRTQKDFDEGEPPEVIRAAQEDLAWADHIVMFYPLWMGTMPALLKGFLEQVLRPGFATSKVQKGTSWQKMLKGKSARIVITMGMPALAYRWYYRAHSLKSLERNILGFCGIGPIQENLFGLVEAVSDDKRAEWLAEMRKLGHEGS